MREIKFRAWDVENKKMIQSYAHLSKWGQFYTTWTSTDSEREYIPMQYTGLKDKNGKEIYEGDIIGDTEDWSIVIWCDKCIGWQLAWYDIDAKTCHMCDGNFNILETFENNIAKNNEEVIGNIYENPELLDK